MAEKIISDNEVYLRTEVIAKENANRTAYAAAHIAQTERIFSLLWVNLHRSRVNGSAQSMVCSAWARRAHMPILRILR